MIKKLIYAFILSLGFTAANAMEALEVTDVAPGTSTVVAPYELVEPVIQPKKHVVLFNWMKEHKALSALIIATLAGAGTLCFSPEARTAVVDGFDKLKNSLTPAAAENNRATSTN